MIHLPSTSQGRKRVRSWLGLAIFLSSYPCLLAQNSSENPTFSVDVKLVNVFVTVQDSTGAPVGGLEKDNFKLTEDGIPQKIAVFNRESELPLSIVLEVDASLSTKKDLALELASARKFSRSILRPIDAISLYQFSESVTELTPFTNDIKKIESALQRVTVGAATALYDAVFLGSRALTKREGRKVLVAITDGGDTLSQIDYKAALRAAQQSEAIVYSIIVVPIESSAGRDIGGEHALIQLSHDTGGKHYYAIGVNQLDKAFRQISDELRTQYLLAYYPSRRFASSDFRRISVSVEGGAIASQNGSLSPRHRTGYFTSKDE